MKAIGLLAAASMMAGCGIHHAFEHGPQIQGSGKSKTEDRKVGSFKRIVSAGSANCRVVVGSETAVSVTADDNLLDKIETRVENDTLVIECKGSFSTRNPITVNVKTPSLEAFATRGCGDSQVAGINAKSFSGEISGSGNLKGSGQTDALELTIRGSGSMEFDKLKARDAEATISGSGDIRLFATGVLNAEIRGSGSVRYSGNPSRVNKSITGSGEIEAQ